MSKPITLQQAIIHYADPKNCIAEMVAQRWPDGVVVCPTCGRNDVTWMPKDSRWQCKSQHSKRKFSVKVGTIYEDSALGLDKWLMATWMLSNCKNGVSSYEISRAIGVTQKSAWFMLQHIRLAMQEPNLGTKIGGSNGGEVEVDESFVGGKLKNMHRNKANAIRANMPQERLEGYETRYDNKVAVLGMFDRQSRQVRAKVVKNVKRETLQNEILKNVKYGSNVYTDQAVAYDTLKRKYIHDTVNHADEYVRGQVHTNCLENFWSIMKRNLTGTYVAVEPFHLDRYLDEQMFRFNNRAGKNDGQRFRKVLSQVAGKRLTYAEVTGKVGQTAF